MSFIKEFYYTLKCVGFNIDPKTPLNKRLVDFTAEDGCLIYLRDSYIKERKYFPEFTDAEYAEHLADRDEEQYNLYRTRELALDMVDYTNRGSAALTLVNDDRGIYDAGDLEELGIDVNLDSDSDIEMDADNLDDIDEGVLDDSDDS